MRKNAVGTLSTTTFTASGAREGERSPLNGYLSPRVSDGAIYIGSVSRLVHHYGVGFLIFYRFVTLRIGTCRSPLQMKRV